MKRSRIPRPFVAAGLVVAGVLTVAACAADSTTGAESGEAPRPAEVSTEAGAGDLLPSVSLYVLDGKGGETQVNLQDIFPASKPVVMWFWAPF